MIEQQIAIPTRDGHTDRHWERLLALYRRNLVQQ